ncbi:NADH-flavin oxidoreductase / NADH oxidase [Mucor ambiguus]|uniref:NADH-flavin oxidoreductase / NADH oxidase n=1 Tax=Mucor ambiguus TaxID=91626 RepID=A0A0C9LT56_9FUNG|nr:NADH-flavin oxidoreductase / NADH oxidase [Mucor ambiguus]
MSTSQALFFPIKVGANTLKHRVVLAPLTRLRATTEAVPTDLQAEYYKQRASEGGLLIAEGTAISPVARAWLQAPGIYSKEQVEGWKTVTSNVHAKGAVIFLQLFHSGRVGSKDLNPNQEPVVGPSEIPSPGKNLHGADYEVPHALTLDEMMAVKNDFVQAARNAIEAGFDGVEIHCANGYLLDQFINSSSNQRTDIYGGSFKNRARFPLEVVDAVVEAIGAESTGVRFSPGSDFQGMVDDNVEETWGYLTSKLQENHPGLAYLHMIECRSSIFTDTQEGLADTLEPYRKLFKGPFITAGGLSSSQKFAEEIAEKTGDLIAYGRAFIANPDLPKRLRNGLGLAPYDRDTFYTNEAKGYTDYPYYSEKE